MRNIHRLIAVLDLIAFCIAVWYGLLEIALICGAWLIYDIRLHAKNPEP